MPSYWLNIAGLGMNLIATVLLMKFSLDTKSTGGATVSQEWEREFFEEFRSAIKTAQYAVVLLMVGFGLQLFAVLLPPSSLR